MTSSSEESEEGKAERKSSDIEENFEHLSDRNNGEASKEDHGASIFSPQNNNRLTFTNIKHKPKSDLALNLHGIKMIKNRQNSPVAQSPLLMPMLNVNKQTGNESVRSGSSRGFTKPKLNNTGLASRLAKFRPKLGLGSGSQADMISTRSYQLGKEYQASKVNNFDLKYEMCKDKKLGEGMHTTVYECKRKFDIDDKSSSDMSDPDHRRVTNQLQELNSRGGQFAVKIVRDNDQEKLAAHEREFEIL